jgi:6-phosphogluconolactonase
MHKPTIKQILKLWVACMVLPAILLTSSCGTHHSTNVTPRSSNQEFLFVAGDGVLISAEINPSSGTLSSLQQVQAPSSPMSITVSNDGLYLYLLDSKTSSIAGYEVASSGVLVGISGSPFSLDSGVIPFSLVSDPKANLLYMPDFGVVTEIAGVPGITGGLSGFTIDGSTGSLTSLGNSPLTLPANETFSSIDPSGRFLYVTNASSSANLTGFSVNLNSGKLTTINGAPWSVPVPPNGAPGFLIVDSTGKFLYIDTGSQGLFGYTVSGIDGGLTPLSGSPFATGAGVTFLSIQSAGDFLYAMSPTDSAVLGFKINATTGMLTPMIGSPFPAGTAKGGLTIDRSGRFLFVVDHDADLIRTFDIDLSTGALSPVNTISIPITGSDPLFVASF